MPLGGHLSLRPFWYPVVARIEKVLDGWKGVFFSLGGRITVVSCVSRLFLSIFFLSF